MSWTHRKLGYVLFPLSKDKSLLSWTVRGARSQLLDARFSNMVQNECNGGNLWSASYAIEKIWDHRRPVRPKICKQAGFDR